MGDVSREEALVAWFNTFPDTECRRALDLVDGVIMATALAEMASDAEAFDLSQIKPGVDSWGLRVSNLKKVSSWADRLLSDLGHAASEFPLESLSDLKPLDGMGPETDDASVPGGALSPLLDLAEIVLFCAVSCDARERYIGRIMEMEQREMQGLQVLVQSVMGKYGGGGGGGGGGNTSNNNNNNTSVNDASVDHGTPTGRGSLGGANEALSARARQLERALAEAEDAKAALETECAQLRQKCESLPSREEFDSLTAQCGKLAGDLQDAQQRLKSVTAELDASRAESADLQRKASAAKESAKELERLRDETDVLRSEAQSVPRLEAQVEKLKVRLEEAADVKRRLRESEEERARLVDAKVRAEEEVKGQGNVKGQVDALRSKVLELEDKLSEATIDAQRKDFELTQRDSRITALEDKARHFKEALEESRRELEVAKGRSSLDDSGTADGAGNGGGNSLMAALQEPSQRHLDRIAELEREVGLLKGLAADPSDESDSNGLRDRVTKLESRLLSVDKDRLTAEADATDAREKLEQATEELEALRREAKRGGKAMTELSEVGVRAKEAEKRAAEAESALGAKEEELAAMRRDLDAAESDLLKARQELGMTGLSEEKLREAIRAEAQEEAKKSIEEATREANERCEALEAQARENETLLASAASAREELETLKADCEAKGQRIQQLLEAKDSLGEEALALQREVTELRQKETELRVTLGFKEEELGRERERAGELGAGRDGLGGQLGQLRDDLTAKEREVHALQLRLIEAERDSGAETSRLLAEKDKEISRLENDRKNYKEYVANAKKKIKELQDRIGTGGGASGKSIDALRDQLRQREEEVAFLKQVREEEKANARREEQMIVSAFYELGEEVVKLRQRVAQGQQHGGGGPRLAVANSLLGKARAAVP